jgi:membrane peptidoglycan carboxypeptidase
VPPGLLDELASIELRGDVRAKLDVHVDSADLDATKLDFDIEDKCKFVSLPEPMNVQRFARPFTHRVLEPDGSMFEMETGPGTPAWTPIELISPFMIQAVVAHEDGRFFNHRGFAETEIGAALAKNLKARAFRFGASTITMQLVKNVFLHRDKLLSRKFQEALIVWWLEQHVDKKWILELYLNVIEYGPSIYGIRNAALHYFGVLPLQLTPAQAAFLATILPSPKSYGEQYAKGTISDSTKSRVGKFLQHMRSRERIDEEALAYGLEELAHFRFYDKDQPPPVPTLMRGSAQALPFQVGPVEGWNTFDPAAKVEDGSFGVGL